MQDLARATIDTQNCGFCVSIFFGTATLIAHRVGGGSLQLRSGAVDPLPSSNPDIRMTGPQQLQSPRTAAKTGALTRNQVLSMPSGEAWKLALECRVGMRSVKPAEVTLRRRPLATSEIWSAVRRF